MNVDLSFALCFSFKICKLLNEFLKAFSDFGNLMTNFCKKKFPNFVGDKLTFGGEKYLKTNLS